MIGKTDLKKLNTFLSKNVLPIRRGLEPSLLRQALDLMHAQSFDMSDFKAVSTVRAGFEILVALFADLLRLLDRSRCPDKLWVVIERPEDEQPSIMYGAWSNYEDARQAALDDIRENFPDGSKVRWFRHNGEYLACKHDPSYQYAVVEDELSAFIRGSDYPLCSYSVDYVNFLDGIHLGRIRLVKPAKKRK